MIPGVRREDIERLTTEELDGYRRELAAHADRLVRRQRMSAVAEHDRVVRALLARGWR